VEIGSASSADPKHLFRELDRLFDGLDKTSSPLALLAGFLQALEERPQGVLPIAYALIYVERGHQFRLERRVGSPPDGWPPSLDPKQPALEELLHAGARVFVDAAGPEGWGRQDQLSVPLACLVVGEGPRRHLVCIGLREAWGGERASFVLGTLHSALEAHLSERFLRGAVREAAQIQRSLLPKDPPQFPNFDIAFACHPAEEVGGDLYDFYDLDADLLGLAIGDASGHGLPAALLVRDVVIGLRMGLERELKIGQVFSKLNRIVHRSHLSSRFISLFYGELEANGNLFYVNAGHQPPLLFDERGVMELTIGGTVLGPLTDTRFRRGFAPVDRGATLVLYTDGVVERANRHGEEFGAERIAHALAGASRAPACEAVERIVTAAREFGHDLPWQDDATVLVVRRM
jgi:sigma-B regulation protein RsbU (phosphoserine phosphatase)